MTPLNLKPRTSMLQIRPVSGEESCQHKKVRIHVFYKRPFHIDSKERPAVDLARLRLLGSNFGQSLQSKVTALSV